MTIFMFLLIVVMFGLIMVLLKKVKEEQEINRINSEFLKNDNIRLNKLEREFDCWTGD